MQAIYLNVPSAPQELAQHAYPVYKASVADGLSLLTLTVILVLLTIFGFWHPNHQWQYEIRLDGHGLKKWIRAFDLKLNECARFRIQ
jgi:hypothetical protein